MEIPGPSGRAAPANFSGSPSPAGRVAERSRGEPRAGLPGPACALCRAGEGCSHGARGPWDPGTLAGPRCQTQTQALGRWRGWGRAFPPSPATHTREGRDYLIGAREPLNPTDLVSRAEKAAPCLGPSWERREEARAPSLPGSECPVGLAHSHRVSCPEGPRGQVGPGAAPAPVKQRAFPPARPAGLKSGSRGNLGRPSSGLRRRGQKAGTGRRFQRRLRSAPRYGAIPGTEQQPFCCVGERPGPGPVRTSSA